jgi:hypothetical protein
MLTKPAYKVRLEYVSGGDFIADWFSFDSIVATKESSWGAIKNIYRD